LPKEGYAKNVKPNGMLHPVTKVAIIKIRMYYLCKYMAKIKFSANNIVFGVFIILLIIPQTRSVIQIGLQKLKVAVWSPSVEAEEDQLQLDPFAYKVTTLAGENTLVPIGKEKVTFLSYWATWCPPCLAELPNIQALYEDYGDRVNFVLLTNEAPKIVEAFLLKKGYSLPVYFPQMNTPEALEERSIPTNYIIDARGKIIIKETGAANWNSAQVRTLLDTLLAE